MQYFSDNLKVAPKLTMRPDIETSQQPGITAVDTVVYFFARVTKEAGGIDGKLIIA